MVPLAPGRLETITGCFQISPISRATARATRSTDPPAGKGATIVTGFSGKLWAAAPALKNRAQPAVNRVRMLIPSSIGSLSDTGGGVYNPGTHRPLD